MIRLAICGLEGPALLALGRRLRGAVVDPPGDRDAAVVLDCSTRSIATAELFLRSGRRVLVTPAVCPSLELLEGFVDLCRVSAGRLAILNSTRYLPSRQLIKNQIDAGKLGVIGLVRIHHWEPDDNIHRGAVLSSILDLAAWLVGKEPACVYAVSDANPAYTQVHLGFAGGAAALVDVCMPRPWPAPVTGTIRQDCRSLSVIGSTGAAYADDQMREPEGHLACAAMTQEFVNGIQSAMDFGQTVSAWRGVLKIGQAVERSLTMHQVVRLEGS